MPKANMPAGKVYLVGAGPGDPGLITVKGRQILNEAEVIIYDYLANPRLLDEARPEAEVIYVGKTGHNHHIDQEAINSLLLEKAKEGKTICRLKGGDSFVFGRGGEEAIALAEAGIPFQVVPGVSSVYSVPAYAGIPVTHRGVASDVAFITGHEDPSKGETSINWEKLAQGVGTLAFVMGVTNLPRITKELIAHGRDPKTPVALIRWGTMPAQRTLIGTLEDIAGKAAAEGFKPPAITVIGEVVNLREKISWFEQRPLFGKRVLVTRSRDQASALVSALEDLGAESVEFPTIQTRALAGNGYNALDEAIRELAGHDRGDGRILPVDELGEEDLEPARLRRAPAFDWIIFTSANGVRYFLARLHYHQLDTRALADAKIVAVGPATADALRSFGIFPDLVPEQYVAEGVLEAMTAAGVSAGSRALLPRAKVARDLIPEKLSELGVEVFDAPAYETVPVKAGASLVIGMLERGELDYITFTSSSTAKNFAEALQEAIPKDSASELPGILSSARIVSIGPITTKTAQSYGMRVDVEPKDSTIPGLVAAMTEDAAAR